MAEKILVVADEFSTRTNLCKYLSGKGYEIHEALNGAEALAVLAGEPFDLVVTDFILPHVDGLQLAELIDGKWPQLPVILITDYLTARAGEMIFGGKVAEIFNKPIKLDEFSKTVKRILEFNT